MTQLFKDMRLYGFITLMLLAATVLGLSAYLGSILLPNYQHDFGIFAIFVPSFTILIFLIIITWSSPRTEAFVLFIFGVLWLAMGAWTTDITGNVQCDALGSQRTSTMKGTISAKSYCYEMKVIEAFSWMIFCLYAIFLFILISLTTRARVLGRPFAWAEPIFELPWFGELPGWPAGAYGNIPMAGYGYPMGPYQPYGGAQMVNGGYVIQQNPGHSVVVQPGVGGQPPMVTQIPGAVGSV